MFGHTITRLFTRQFTKRRRCVRRRLRHRRADAVHFGLGGVQKFALGITRLGGERAGFLNGLKVVIKVGHNFIHIGG